MALTDSEITMNLVLKMLEMKNINVYTDPDDIKKENTDFINEICKAYKTVYKTVSNPNE